MTISATAAVYRELQALRNELTMTQGELKRTQDNLTVLQKAFEPYKGNQEMIEQLIWTFNLARKLYRSNPCRECQAADRGLPPPRPAPTSRQPTPTISSSSSSASSSTSTPVTPPLPSRTRESEISGGAANSTPPTPLKTSMEDKIPATRPPPTGSGSSPPATPLQKGNLNSTLGGISEYTTGTMPILNMTMETTTDKMPSPALSMARIAEMIYKSAGVCPNSSSSTSSSSSSSNGSTCSSSHGHPHPKGRGGSKATSTCGEPARSKKRDEPCSSAPPSQPPLQVGAGPAFHVGNAKRVGATEKDRRSSHRHAPVKRKTMGATPAVATPAAHGGASRTPMTSGGFNPSDAPLFAPVGENGTFQFGRLQSMQPDGAPQFFTFQFGAGLANIAVTDAVATAFPPSTPSTTTTCASSATSSTRSSRATSSRGDGFDYESLFKAVELLQGLHSLSPPISKSHPPATKAETDDEAPPVALVK